MYIYIYINIQIYIHIYIHIGSSVLWNMNLYINMPEHPLHDPPDHHIHECKYIDVYIRIYILTDTHLCMHTHTPEEP